MTAPTRRIVLIDRHPGQTVVWVDDRVMLTRDDLKILTKAGNQEVWSIPENYRVLLTGQNLPLFGENTFHLAAKEIIRVCDECCRNLALVDFRTAHELAKAGGDYLWLLDLQNITQSLGYTSLTLSPQTDRAWKWVVYGAEFAQYYQVPPHRFRFATRYRGIGGINPAALEERAEDLVLSSLKDVYRGTFTEDTHVQSHSLRLDNIAQLRGQLSAFLRSNDAHSDPLVSDAVAFSISPPGGTWHHDKLKPRCASSEEGIQCLAFARWLGCAVSCESGIGLLLSPTEPPWSVTSVGVRSITSKALKDVALKLGLRQLTVNPDISEIVLPIQPGLPFLLALAALVRTMENDPDYFPPKAWFLDESGGKFCLRITLDAKERRPGKQISANKLVGAYNTALAAKGGEPLAGFRRQHLVSRDFVRFAYGIVELNRQNPLAGEKRPFFAGMPNPIVSVYADETDRVVIIAWPQT